MMLRSWIYLIFILHSSVALSQHKFELDGQLSALLGYTPDSQLDLLLAGRYIPELSYSYNIDSTQLLDFEFSANIFGSVSSLPFDTLSSSSNLSPYRMWARYSGKQFEIRAGLQKIDFGSATLLRPLQWFNEIDPRDPLQLTNGVYGVLGRYYFLNNTNVWVWGLYGNKNQRGFDAIPSNPEAPEFGGRIQTATTRGEIALSYHHREADASLLFNLPGLDNIAENKIALDGKWDHVVGFWTELSHSFKNKEIGILTNQSLINLGVDYTFGIGNGLNVIAEHLIIAYNQSDFNTENTIHITATTLNYPLSLFDHLITVVYYDWSTENAALFLNYQHSFKRITGYAMAFYNPATQQGIRQNDLTNTMSGPGIRLMLVYNH